MDIVRSVLLWGSQNQWVERQFRRRRFARRAVSRFMPGEDVAAALREASALNAKNIPTIFTQLGENVSTLDETEQVTAHYLDVLARIDAARLPTHISVKLTQLGLDLDPTVTDQHLATLLDAAAERNNVVWIDMEASPYVDATLAAFETARRRRANVGLCLQAYLRRTPDDLERVLDLDAPVRLVKGAYREPPEVAYPMKRDVDAAYLHLVRRMMERPPSSGIRHGIATHDLAIIAALRHHADQSRIDASGFEVEMLYGIRRGEQERLAAAGVAVRVLVSYGEAWFAWYMRRLAERPANIGFVLRSMVAR